MATIDINDSWDTTDAQSVHKRTYNSSKVTCGYGGYSAAYMQTVASDGVHEWVFYLHNVNANNGGTETAAIGIVPTDSAKDKAYPKFLNNGAFMTRQGKLYGGDAFLNSCSNGDTIYMKINFNEKSLSYAVNERNYKKACDIDISKQYIAAVRVALKDSCIEYIKHCYVTEDEQKKNENEHVEEQSINSKDNEDIVNKLTIENEALKKLIQELNEDKTKSRNENDLLNERICELENEKKEMQIKINEMENEIKELKITAMDTKKYKEWDSNQIFVWIMSLDDGTRYKRYEQVLKIQLKEQEVTGADLKSLELNYMKELGITAFKDKKYLYDQIQALTRQNKSQYVNNEGSIPTAYV
eukprot:90499_1